MAEQLDIINDKDLEAPLALGKRYEQLANDFEAVAAASTLMMKKIEAQDATIGKLSQHTKELEKEIKKLEEANKKSAKAQKEYAEATKLADSATGGMVSRVKDLGKQFLVLLANPITGFLLAIAGALASVGAYFRTSSDGALKLEKIMAAIGAVSDFLINKVAALGEQIVKLFEDGNIVGELFMRVFGAVINIVSGVIDTFTNLLKIINILSQYNLKEIFTGNLKPEDIEALKKATIDLGKAGIQAFTGMGNAAEEAAAKIESLVKLTEAADKLDAEMRDRILSKAKAELEIEKLLFDAKDKTGKSDNERLGALQKALNIGKEQLKIDLDLATRNERIFTAKLLQRTGIINSDIEANRVLAAGTTLLQDQLLEGKALGNELKERKVLQADVFNLQRAFFAENKKAIGQIGALQKEIDDEAIKRAEIELAARLRIYDEQLAKSKVTSGQEIIGFKSAREQQDEINKRFNQRMIDDQKARDDKQKELDKERTEKWKEEHEKRRAIAQASIQAVGMLGDEIFQRRQEKLDEELKQSEARRAIELAGAGDNEQKKLAINRKFDREQAKIKTKQAQADKQNALFNILISTAMGIARVAPNPVLIALVAGIGALQAALVASRPLPKFWKGAQNTPDSFIAGDRGRELVTRGQDAFVANKSTIFTDMAGAKVFTKAQTDDILGNSSDVGYALNYGSRIKSTILGNTIIADRLREGNSLLKKIANKPTTSLYVDENGFGLYLNKMDQHRARVNRRFRGI